MRALLNTVKQFGKNPKIVGFLLSMIVLLFIITLEMNGTLQVLELAIYDKNIMFEHNRLEKKPPVLLVMVKES
ncbi:MAG: hypothetical protein OEW97_04385, partial [Gammaproteobacteria bacterium]|nr:hypothetical protein [Gammaproteobacteria bacterium]